MASAQAPDASGGAATQPEPPAAGAPAQPATASASGDMSMGVPVGQKLWVGAGINLFPNGSISVSSGGDTTSTGTAFAYGFEINADYMITPMIFVGLAPRYILGVKPSDDNGGDSASEIDIRARVGAIKMVAPKINVYGYASLGYSSISFPTEDGVSTPSANGLTVGIAAGAKYDVAPKARLFGELGYEFGFQSISEDGQSEDTHLSWFHIAVGAQFAAM